jgi:hypothetical protein
MSEAFSAWLPRGAVDAPAVRRLVADTAESWSRKWFAAGALSAEGFEAVPRGAWQPAPDWRVYGSAVALAPCGSALIPLAGLALGAEPERLVLSEVDRDIIGRFTTGIAADLALSLERALGLDPPGEAAEKAVEDPLAGGGLAFALENGVGTPLLRAAIPVSAIAGFVKGRLPPARARAPLGRLARALGATPVRIEARLGRTVVPLGELAGLAPGDVLVLDRAIARGAGLALDRAGHSFADAAIAERGDGVALLLSSQPRET